MLSKHYLKSYRKDLRSKHNDKPLKILDVCAGIGGFSYAAENFFQGQFKTTQFVEINPFCQKVLSKNFKGVPIHDDIQTFTAPKGSFLCGGFPCQDISVAGSQRGISGETRRIILRVHSVT